MSGDKKNEDYTIDMGDQKLNGAFEAAAAPPLRMPAAPQASQLNSPVIAILSYCGSSILMTTTNKYVLSGLDFNLNFFLLAVQVNKSAPSFFSSSFPSFFPSFFSSFLPSFFPSFLPPFLPSSLPPFLPSSLPPFLPSSLPPFLPCSRTFLLLLGLAASTNTCAI
jgi:hypothetical protein